MWKTNELVNMIKIVLQWLHHHPRIIKDAIKGGLAPVIGLSLFQYYPFAEHYEGIGFLVGIMTILSRCYQPRARYVQHIAYSTGSICLGTCIALLSAYCATQARLHRSNASEQRRAGGAFASYNSSASVIAALFLFVNITFANAVRLSRPQLQHPLVMYSILAIVTSVYIPTFEDMEECIAFILRVMEAFLGSFGIATVIHFVVFPHTSRGIVLEGARKYVEGIKNTLSALDACMRLLGRSQSDDTEVTDQGMAEGAFDELMHSLSSLVALHEKQKAELVFAKREVAIGRLDPKHLKTLQSMLREIFLPLLGLQIIIDGSRSGLNENQMSGRKVYSDLRSLQNTQGALELGADMNSTGNLITRVRELLQSTQDALEISGVLRIEESMWVKNLMRIIRREPSEKEIESALPEKSQMRIDTAMQLSNVLERVRLQKERAEEQTHKQNCGDSSDLGFTAYQQWFTSIEFLVAAVANATLDFSQWNHDTAESLKQRRLHLIHPGIKLLHLNPFEKQKQPWMHDAEEASGADHDWAPSSHPGEGEADGPPVEGFWPIFGRALHSLVQFFRSMEIVFGFRCACATLTVGVVAFLKATQVFFIEQRLHWAMIMIAVGMSLNTGSGIFSLLRRVGGTLLGAATVMTIWYIAGGRGIPGAVLPISFIPLALEVVGVLVWPTWASFFMLAMVTQSLVLGYQLEEGVIGVEALEDNGSPYYPMYLLAPYRLAAVAGGCLVAFIWTYFPFPISDRTTIREQLGDSIYRLAGFVPLMAQIHDFSEDRAELTLDSLAGDVLGPKEEAQQLTIQLATISQLRVHLDSVKFEPSFGRRYPTTQYGELVTCVRNLLNIRSLIVYASGMSVSYPKVLGFQPQLTALEDLAEKIDTCLILASFHIRNRIVMPGHIRPPLPADLGGTGVPIRALFQHERETGSFAVLKVAYSLLSEETKRLFGHIRMLEQARTKQS